MTARVPTVLERSMLRVDVATHVGTPDAVVVRMEALVVDNVLSAVEPEPYNRELDATDERPVPPPVTFNVPERVGVNVNVPVELVIAVPYV